MIVEVYEVVVMASVLLEWCRSPLHVRDRGPSPALMTRWAVRPVLRLIRRNVPSMAGGIDLSPLVLMLALEVLRGTLLRFLSG